MKIVIDIPEKIYNRYINYTESYIDFMFIGTEEILVKAIRNGTPLPKGHGRLIDENEIKKMIEEAKVDSEHSKSFAENIIRFAPKIIEADKAESEDKE